MSELIELIQYVVKLSLGVTGIFFILVSRKDRNMPKEDSRQWLTWGLLFLILHQVS